MTHRIRSVRYAVALGCVTAARLAAEWRTSKRSAADALHDAWISGCIRRVRRGVYSARLDAIGTLTCPSVDADISEVSAT